jgi:hypothetical protein
MKTVGIVIVADLAATAEGRPPKAAMTFTRRAGLSLLRGYVRLTILLDENPYPILPASWAFGVVKGCLVSVLCLHAARHECRSQQEQSALCVAVGAVLARVGAPISHRDHWLGTLVRSAPAIRSAASILSASCSHERTTSESASFRWGSVIPDANSVQRAAFWRQNTGSPSMGHRTPKACQGVSPN